MNVCRIVGQKQVNVQVEVLSVMYIFGTFDVLYNNLP